MRAVIFAADFLDRARVQRTFRSLSAANIAATFAPDRASLAAQLSIASEPLWLIRSGAWQPNPRPLRSISPSASGKALVGVGGAGTNSLYVEPPAARRLTEWLAKGEPWERAVQQLTRARMFRCVPLHDIEVRFDPALRVVQLVTTIQMGGAERVALDLAHECNRLRIPTVVAALGLPTRRAFAPPRFFADLSEVPNDPSARADAVHRLSCEWGADVVHAHLIRASEAEAVHARGLPLVVTLHNMSTSWPAGYKAAGTPFADLLIGCAEAVTREITARIPGVPARTVWNGIDPRRAASVGIHEARELRASLGWDESDFVMIAVANPRTQKRLERLPEIIGRLEGRIGPRRVRLILAGEPAAGSADAREATTALEQEIEQWHVQKALHWPGAVDDVAPLLAAADVYVSTSDVEGLSLAQLEALAAGLPLVVTNVGGASELAELTDRVTLLDRNADAEAFANALARLANAAPSRTPALPKSFTRDRMASRAQLLYRGVLVQKTPRASRRTVWLLTNNFSTGGAQTSARRLLTGLAARGHPVRAATVQDDQQALSTNRHALADAGVFVTSIRPNANPEELASELLDALNADPPRAVLFWNLITPVKVLLADALIDVPIFDVSPGEMFFQALERFFAAIPPGLPVPNAKAYGARLAGVSVKYEAEAQRARENLGATVHVIPNGLPLPPVRERRRGKRLVIGTAARISPDKRLDQLIDAIREAHRDLPAYELRIAGGPDGSNSAYFGDLQRLARGLPVKWLGRLHETASFLAGLDIFAMISEPAGCPNASLEAMAAGLPIVATDHGGVSEQVIDGVNGRLVPRSDTRAFANALLDLASDASVRTRMGVASRGRVESHFNIDGMVTAYSQMIRLPV